MTNKLLVNFDFIVDLDFAMIKFIKENYYDSQYVSKNILDMSEDSIKNILINRKYINPLELLFKDNDTTDLYFELTTEKINFLLDYATVYDTYPLLITMKNNASSLDIIIHCNNTYEENYIKNLNGGFNTITCSNANITVNKYDIFYIKYLAQIIEYQHLEGKHIYVANARYNMDDGKDRLKTDIAMLFGDVNLLHSMDLYVDYKYKLQENHKEINPMYSIKRGDNI